MLAANVTFRLTSMSTDHALVACDLTQIPVEGSGRRWVKFRFAPNIYYHFDSCGVINNIFRIVQRYLVYPLVSLFNGTVCFNLNVLIICMYYYITTVYGGCRASDVLHVLMGVSVA